MTRTHFVGLAGFGSTLATLGVVARRVATPADETDEPDGLNGRTDFQTATTRVVV